MRVERVLTSVLLVLVLATTGCNFGCDPLLTPGIRVTVLDSISNKRLGVNNVTVVAIHGTFADTARVGADGRFAATVERPGTYRVQVTAPGYSPWQQQGVRVEAPGDCGNPDRTIELTARMRSAD